MLDASVSREIQDDLTVLLKHLPAQDLGEQVGRIGFARDVPHVDAASPTQLTHLEHLTIDVARVGRRSEPVAQVKRGLAICIDLNSCRDLMPKE